ncbi:MAG TPA: hypothetical protein VJ438_01295, partial [Candidatus Nanoarchaeia archaeon]|nr:hypothetical protein [Candidatus Nanoarchaeia archaeon]
MEDIKNEQLDVGDFITFVNNLADTSESESLRGFLINLDKNELKIKINSPRGYYFVTDLVNPTKKYLVTKFPTIPTDIEIQKKFIKGDKIHGFAEIWIKNVEGCVSSESKLDGFLLDIPVTGKIDCKINENIVDFKSKEKIPETPKEIIEKYPHDIEQLMFYSALDPTHPIINYLVFISQGSEQKLKSFKITLKDPDKIRDLMFNRINLLDNVLKGDLDLSELPKCNYCLGKECGYYKEGICKWLDKNNALEIGNLVNIEEDLEFNTKLQDAKNKWNGEDNLYSINNLLNSRKYFYTNILEWGLSDKYEIDIEKNLSKGYIDKLAYNLRVNNGTDITQKPSIINKKIRDHNKWIFLKTHQKPDGKIMPYVVSVCLSKKEGYLAFK